MAQKNRPTKMLKIGGSFELRRVSWTDWADSGRREGDAGAILRS